ncbi:hypothetical protein DJ021_11595 [Phenylobacterium hankyongense]|uniref:DUF805 domain-containing protein n=1 Tax=Phenylobacterium hankyongense TaxID=1813876 RepID=A0A328AZQ0_9CAUL|nr:DUF805 domain-containing protein [Phenylobacterium hankyongense]RAK60403.1 hypothetical protein DJ021_11595 [Phenylobacterium hankyongense]
MTDPTADAPSRRRPWLAGRSGRREYWLLVAMIFALGFALSFIPGLRSANSALTVVLALVQARRIHDFGRTGWWALLAAVAPAACLPLMMVISMEAALGVGLLLELALIVWIGAVPGDTGENRFGPSVAFAWKRALVGR